MFSDERIDQHCGRIYRRGILFATVVAALYALYRGYILIDDGAFRISLLWTELFMIVTGITVMLVGALRFHGKQDERVEYEKHLYYLGAGKVFLIMTLAGYAFSILSASGRTSGDLLPNQIILTLELLGVPYFYYSFRAAGINFNYSFIAEPSSEYYKRVFLNIAKLAGILLIPFGLALVLAPMLWNNLLLALSIFLAYLGSVFGLGIEYLYISFLERVSYQEESERLLRKSVVIAGAVMLVFLIANGASHTLYVWFATTQKLTDRPLGSMPFGEILAYLMQWSAYFGNIRSLFTYIALGHFLESVLSSAKARKAIRNYILFGAVGILWSELPSRLVVRLANTVMDSFDGDYALGYRLLEARQYVTFALTLCSLAALFFLAHALCRDLGVSLLVFLFPILRLAVIVVNLLIATRSEAMVWTSVFDLLSVLVFILGWAILFRARDKKYTALPIE